ncbi:selenoneine synthase SenA [Limnobacter parvus]|uniref:SUMF1/EgtB/PvdO family nonheme iron enzyme n=1 Tax=Limnobacter parvus TaxID=2939690 RepID=A0ABT1XNS8_9BURK|nr:selenoneine synthase SenA [Limnobacter parvus]MCR2747932.1 SUMF1/EgtB/PvdO family nonheme iron enzyme [Limnobacter parvus]
MNNQQTLLHALENSRDRVLSLLNSLDPEQLSVPYSEGINPPVWEVGHATFFFERFILQYLDSAPSYNPALDDIWDSFELAHEDRWQTELFPDKVETLHYFHHTFDRVKQRIQEKPLSDADLYMYKYAIFHLNMHIESMVWCRQTLGYAPPPGAHAPCASAGLPNAAQGDVEIPAGRYRIGMPEESPSYATDDFCFDNEKPGFIKDVKAFNISPTLVSNAEYLAFVEAGAYELDSCWSMAGLKWRKQTNARHPLYWKKENGQWLERHYDKWLRIEPSLPVKHVSYWEAQAYCNFTGRRLPKEFEWEVAALNNIEGRPFNKFPWGNTMDPTRVDMDCTHLARLPVNALPEGDSPFGCRQMIGTVWEWTESLFFPYSGFTMDVYPFMSTLQFGDHKVVRGGSCATSSILIRGTYRQAYLPDRNDVFVGFRTCAR